MRGLRKATGDSKQARAMPAALALTESGELRCWARMPRGLRGMNSGIQHSKSLSPRGNGAGFVRHDLYLAFAFILLAVALVVPRLVRGDGLGALIALLVLVGVVVAGIGMLLALSWLGLQMDRPGAGWRDRTFQWAGHLARCLMFGFIGLLVATAIAAQHGLGSKAEAWISLSSGAISGVSGLWLYQRLGKTRFWSGFKWFGLALLGSFIGGIVGILGPEPWSIDAGIVIPLGVFLLLALTGRVGPRRRDEAADDSGSS
jgi:hypothetical protein